MRIGIMNTSNKTEQANIINEFPKIHARIKGILDIEDKGGNKGGYTQLIRTEFGNIANKLNLSLNPNNPPTIDQIKQDLAAASTFIEGQDISSELKNQLRVAALSDEMLLKKFDKKVLEATSQKKDRGALSGATAEILQLGMQEINRRLFEESSEGFEAKLSQHDNTANFILKSLISAAEQQMAAADKAYSYLENTFRSRVHNEYDTTYHLYTDIQVNAKKASQEIKPNELAHDVDSETYHTELQAYFNEDKFKTKSGQEVSFKVKGEFYTAAHNATRYQEIDDAAMPAIVKAHDAYVEKLNAAASVILSIEKAKRESQKDNAGTIDKIKAYRNGIKDVATKSDFQVLEKQRHPGYDILSNVIRGSLALLGIATIIPAVIYGIAYAINPKLNFFKQPETKKTADLVKESHEKLGVDFNGNKP